jgi:hypothetical protein
MKLRVCRASDPRRGWVIWALNPTYVKIRTYCREDKLLFLDTTLADHGSYFLCWGEKTQAECRIGQKQQVCEHGQFCNETQS